MRAIDLDIRDSAMFYSVANKLFSKGLATSIARRLLLKAQERCTQPDNQVCIPGCVFIGQK